MRTTRMFWGVLTMVGMLFASSCSQNELLDNSVDSENYVSATFILNSPEEAITSRADIGDGTMVNKVVCATFDQYGTELKNLRQYREITKKKAQYSIRLVKGQNYRVAFFAYYAPAGTDVPKYYDITNLQNIKVYDAKSNIEERDAFTAYEEIKAGETMKPIERPVTLYRPFAQLNLGSLQDDWTAALKAGVEIDETKVVVSNVYTAFNAYNDAVVGEPSEVTFEFNAIPKEALKIDTEGDKINGKQYKYLALNYILVGDKKNEKSLTNVKFIWKDTDANKTNDPITVFKNIPVQRNYRTNIIGYLLTNPAVFNVTIDERFEKPDYNVDGPSKEVNGSENGGGEGNVTPVVPAEVKFSEIKSTLSQNNGRYVISGNYKKIIIDNLGQNEKILLNNVEVETLEITEKGWNKQIAIELKNVKISNKPSGFKGFWGSVKIDNCSVNGTTITEENKNDLLSLENAFNKDFIVITTVEV